MWQADMFWHYIGAQNPHDDNQNPGTYECPIQYLSYDSAEARVSKKNRHC